MPIWPQFSTYFFSNRLRITRSTSRNILALAILAGGVANAAELLPYDPPRPANRPSQGASSAKGGFSIPFDSVDRNFIRDADRLSVQERSKLATELQALQQKAVKERQWDAAKYYDRLLSLLNGKEL